jgi:hypothetical protein
MTRFTMEYPNGYLARRTFHLTNEQEGKQKVKNEDLVFIFQINISLKIVSP